MVITDIRMPPTGTDEGIRAAAWIRENHPAVGVPFDQGADALADNQLVVREENAYGVAGSRG